MAKNRLEIVAMAHRRLGLLAVDRTPTADQEAFGGDVVDGILAEIEAVHGIALPFTSANVPDGMFLPLSYLVAHDLASHYDVPPRDGRTQMIARIRAYILPDDRVDRRDLDDDGGISVDEADVGARALFY